MSGRRTARMTTGPEYFFKKHPHLQGLQRVEDMASRGPNFAGRASPALGRSDTDSMSEHDTSECTHSEVHSARSSLNSHHPHLWYPGPIINANGEEEYEIERFVDCGVSEEGDVLYLAFSSEGPPRSRPSEAPGCAGGELRCWSKRRRTFDGW
ncbi:hypothetical protein BD626DRAFT_539204 [Schizophyllum amplum]|uniref:Uncharacterized protein n=1 Tax=Schizophyllum amplum TaxID=97359 RepID=A0A550C4M2_9AGAR|nr:hypothetical protein BD626DRAFT_539204 [Auriculariopsis ampla]